jgi:urease accessory protein UreH
MPEAWFGTAVITAPSLAADHTAWDLIRALHRDGCRCGVTTLAPGLWIVRLIAPTGLALRDTLAELRRALAPVLPGLQTDHRKL